MKRRSKDIVKHYIRDRAWTSTRRYVVRDVITWTSVRRRYDVARWRLHNVDGSRPKIGPTTKNMDVYRSNFWRRYDKEFLGRYNTTLWYQSIATSLSCHFWRSRALVTTS